MFNPLTRCFDGKENFQTSISVFFSLKKICKGISMNENIESVDKDADPW